jgi:hypothetical protein
MALLHYLLRDCDTRLTVQGIDNVRTTRILRLHHLSSLLIITRIETDRTQECI